MNTYKIKIDGVDIEIEKLPNGKFRKPDLANKYNGYKYSIAPLKQVVEEIMVFQKPYMTGSCLHDTLAMEAGDGSITCGAVDVDGCRVGTSGGETHKGGFQSQMVGGTVDYKNGKGVNTEIKIQGRYPSQTYCDSGAAEVLDRQSGISKSGVTIQKFYQSKNVTGFQPNPIAIPGYNQHGDTGGCSRILHKCDYEHGEHDLYFYCPKVNKAERNDGLDSYITIKYNIDDLKEVIILCKEENMELAELLKKVMLEWGITNLSIVKSGENITVLCRRDFLSIIKTEISKITELKILNLLQHLFTKDCTQIVNCEITNGGKPVQYAAKQNELIKTTGILQEKNISVITDAASAIYKLLLKISKEKDWQVFTNFHCTVKPIKLLYNILKLFKTPNTQVLLDPFAGSGSIGIASEQLGYDYTLIELNAEYVEIIKARTIGLQMDLTRKRKG